MGGWMVGYRDGYRAAFPGSRYPWVDAGRYPSRYPPPSSQDQGIHGWMPGGIHMGRASTRRPCPRIGRASTRRPCVWMPGGMPIEHTSTDRRTQGWKGGRGGRGGGVFGRKGRGRGGRSCQGPRARARPGTPARTRPGTPARAHGQWCTWVGPSIHPSTRAPCSAPGPGRGPPPRGSRPPTARIVHIPYGWVYTRYI